MSKYIKKPIPVNAEQFDGQTTKYFQELYPDKIKVLFDVDNNSFLEIKTANGPVIANAGDWILSDGKGDVWPCQKDIFEKTYEPYSYVSLFVKWWRKLIKY